MWPFIWYCMAFSMACTMVTNSFVPGALGLVLGHSLLLMVMEAIPHKNVGQYPCRIESMVCHNGCMWLFHWFCCTISMMGTPWHYSVVPIGCSWAHTTWTSLWLLVALAYGRLWGAPMHPVPSIHLHALVAVGVLLVAQHIPWLSELVAKHIPWLSVLVVGMVLESTQCWLGAITLHTKH